MVQNRAQINIFSPGKALGYAAPTLSLMAGEEDGAPGHWSPATDFFYLITCSSFFTSNTFGISFTVMPARSLSPSLLT